MGVAFRSEPVRATVTAMNTPNPLTPSEREQVAAAAHRRARFLRLEAAGGMLPAYLAAEYRAQAVRLELMYPAVLPDAEQTVSEFAAWLEDVTADDF